jgi:glutamate racemase
MMPSARPIGLFDSGVGGLTVMKEVVRQLPHENLIYLGDTAHLPYGEKSPEAILRYTLENTDFLIEQGIKLLIIACHTASSHALDALQQKLSIPVIGVIESGLECLLKAPQKKRIAVLGTASTIGSGVYQTSIQARLPDCEIFAVACPLFVPLIEEGLHSHQATNLIAQHYLGALKNKQIDAALLACTHYPLIRSSIQQTLGEDVTLIEPAEACAKKAFHWLKESGSLNPVQKQPHYQFYATDDPIKFRRLTTLFFGSEIPDIRCKKN